MDEIKERINEWKEIISIYFNQKIPVLIVFKYPQFDKPTYRRGKIIRVGDYSFTLEDVKEGVEHYSYEYIIEVKTLREGSTI